MNGRAAVGGTCPTVGISINRSTVQIKTGSITLDGIGGTNTGAQNNGAQVRQDARVDTSWLAVETTRGETYRVLDLPKEVVVKLPFALRPDGPADFSDLIVSPEQDDGNVRRDAEATDFRLVEATVVDVQHP